METPKIKIYSHSLLPQLMIFHFVMARRAKTDAAIQKKTIIRRKDYFLTGWPHPLTGVRHDGYILKGLNLDKLKFLKTIKIFLILCFIFNLSNLFAENADSTVMAVKTDNQDSSNAKEISVDETIKIGAVLSQTGKLKEVAQLVKKGYDIALDQINTRGGIRVGNRFYKLELIYADAASDPNIAKSAAETLIKKNVRFLLGPYGSVIASAIYPLAEKYKIPFVQSQGTALLLYSPTLKYTFSTSSSADQYLKPAIKLLGEASLAKGRNAEDLKVAIIARDDPGSQDIRSGVVESIHDWKMQLVGDFTVGTSPKDITETLDKIAPLKPDLLVATLQADGARPLINDLTKKKLDLPMIAMTHCDAARIEELKPKSDYILCASQWDAFLNYPDRFFASSSDYAISYNLKYNMNPPYQSAGASAAIIVLADAIERAQSLEPEKVRYALEQTRLKTLYGEIRFDKEKNQAKPVVLYQLMDGIYKIVYPLSGAWSQLLFPMPSWQERVVD
jgi:branched-chain amino acid transport system substrate-binding protein